MISILSQSRSTRQRGRRVLDLHGTWQTSVGAQMCLVDGYEYLILCHSCGQLTHKWGPAQRTPPDLTHYSHTLGIFGCLGASERTRAWTWSDQKGPTRKQTPMVAIRSIQLERIMFVGILGPLISTWTTCKQFLFICQLICVPISGSNILACNPLRVWAELARLRRSHEVTPLVCVRPL